MNWVFVILNLLAQGITGFLGLYLMLRTPRKQHHRLYIWSFGGLTAIGLIVAVAQKYRDDIVQATMQGRIDQKLDDLSSGNKKILQEMGRLDKFLPSGSLEQVSKEKPWGLSADQLVLLAQRMGPYIPKENRDDLITCVLGDPDSTRFAEQLVAAFRSAGWMLGGSGYSQAVFSASPVGIVLKLHSQQSNPAGLSAFVASLREDGIQPTGTLDEKLPDDRFEIIVGRKPQ